MGERGHRTARGRGHGDQALNRRAGPTVSGLPRRRSNEFHINPYVPLAGRQALGSDTSAGNEGLGGDTQPTHQRQHAVGFRIVGMAETANGRCRHTNPAGERRPGQTVLQTLTVDRLEQRAEIERAQDLRPRRG